MGHGCCFASNSLFILYLVMIYNSLPWFRDLIDKLPYLKTPGDVQDVTDSMLSMAGLSGAIGIVLAALAILALALIINGAKKWDWHVSGKVLTSSFALVWLGGFVVYDLGMYVGDSHWSLIGNMPMAAIYSLQMFLMQSDISAIHPSFYHNWIFMLAFSAVHIAAALVTLVFVIKHFGYNIIAGFRMLYAAYFGRKKATYVFWGMNDASFALAKSIKDHYSELKCNKYRIIVVRTNDDKTMSVKNGMERLFNFLSLRNHDLDRMLELDCLTTSTYADLARVKVESMPEDVLRKKLNLRQLARIISCKTLGEAHLFVLTDDAAYNIQAVANLKRDETIKAFVEKVVKEKKKNDNAAPEQSGDAPANDNGNMVYLYCRARYNSLHRVIEDEQLHERIEVRVVDPSHMSVEILKQNVEFHPVSYVDVEKDATVSSAFKSLVVGFGEVGMDIVRFLYEFSAFVKTGTADKGPVQRSEFECHVVDVELKKQAGLFISGAPSIVTDYSSTKDGHYIYLHEMDARGPEFYNQLSEHITELNYIVVAQGDDELNVALAVRIFRFAVRMRKDMNHFRILVMVKNDEDKHFSRIIGHYNRLWAAEEHAENKAKPLHQREITTAAPINQPITMFGEMNDIFNYKYVIADALRQEAQVYKKRYDKSILASTGRAEPDWITEHKQLMQLVEPYKGYSPTLSGLMRLRRTQSQNIENCFHQYTKQLLAQAALGDKYQIFATHCLTREENHIDYQWNGREKDDQVIAVLNVLARTEHLRWVASHEVLGYTDYGTEEDKDEARLMHGCLKPWGNLSTMVQSYDYNVVDVSLGII